MCQTALITGISGQDGIYLAEFLLARGYRVIGTARHADCARLQFSSALIGQLIVEEWDLLDQAKIFNLLACHRPGEVYNLAAYSSGTGMYDNPADIGEINGLAVTRILEAIRQTDKNIRFCQASSREIFGEAIESPQTENTFANPRSPYGAAKLYADAMVRIYRQRYGLFTCSAILFNHESPRRRQEFVTRKIAHAAASIKLGLSDELRLGSLDAQRDWGSVGDYVRAMWMMLQHTQPDDYIVATGEMHTVREFCEIAFRHVGLDYRDYVREDKDAIRPNEPFPLVGCADKAKNVLGWSPQIEFEQLVGMMVDADLTLLGASLKQ
ncbi:MAG: GDP-mannose 4,6-dehydratase [Methylobacillus sp.]|jgi:GDPmannose 4,6-dehydratase|nr:GDP-mannose 4,6-dehydratase [Methylobacillus sp.]